MRLTGTMTMLGDGSVWKMTMPNGQSVDLALSPKALQLNPAWARGFLVDDIPMTVRGTLGADGKFQVEDFAPGSSDKFVTGRLLFDRTPNSPVMLATARGVVEITDKTLAEKFRLAGQLGVILPGDAKKVNGKLVYDGAPSQYFALARPQAFPTPNGDGTFTTRHAMALHGFQGTTIFNDANAAARINHPDRNWVLGDFTLGTGDKAGKLVGFNATYASGPNGAAPVPVGGQTLPDGRDPDPAARQALADALARTPGLARIHQIVANESHTSPPLDLSAFTLKASPPK